MSTRVDAHAREISSRSGTVARQSSTDTLMKGPETKPGFLATVVIPAYNEEKGLSVVLERLYRSVDGQCEVLVVDDGSSDATSQVACRFRCGVIRHSHNRGKGEAMLTGIKHARGNSVIFIDADGTYPPEAIPQMVQALKSCEAVYCSRATGRDNIPRMNRLGNAIFQSLMKHVFRFRASDYSTGLYGIRRSHLQRMGVHSRGFAIEPEIGIKVSRMNLKVSDIPIRYEQRIGQAKLCGFGAGWEHLKIMAKLAWWHPRERDK